MCCVLRVSFVVVGWLLSLRCVRCSLRVVCWLVSVDRCALFAVCGLSVCLLLGVCRAWCDCVLLVVCCLLFVNGCVLLVAYCSLIVVCCSLFVGLR